jgi:hypothetical protein
MESNIVSDGYFEVLGTVADAKYRSLTDGPTPYLFLPLAQKFSPTVTIHVRTFREPMEAVPPLSPWQGGGAPPAQRPCSITTGNTFNRVLLESAGPGGAPGSSE